MVVYVNLIEIYNMVVYVNLIEVWCIMCVTVQGNSQAKEIAWYANGDIVV